MKFSKILFVGIIATAGLFTSCARGGHCQAYGNKAVSIEKLEQNQDEIHVSVSKETEERI